MDDSAGPVVVCESLMRVESSGKGKGGRWTGIDIYDALNCYRGGSGLHYGALHGRDKRTTTGCV